MSWALELSYNLLSIISLAKKNIEIFPRKASQSFEIVVDNKIFGLANIIENQYII